jgi:hypothetical protein
MMVYTFDNPRGLQSPTRSFIDPQDQSLNCGEEILAELGTAKQSLT